MTYEEAVQYIEQASSFGIQLGLSRITALLDILGNPQRQYQTIHVTGTNGKGSVTAMVTAALEAAGYRVGRYTSPHLETYRERIYVHGQLISAPDFAEAIATVQEGVNQLTASGQEAPTTFEMLTAAAFWYFAEKKVDYAVIEVGLGGLLDSTNVITPVVSIITNVDFDHMKYCGHTIGEIATQKAGIIKAGVPVVTTATGEALQVIAKRAYAKQSRLYALHHGFDVMPLPPGEDKTTQAIRVTTTAGKTIDVILPLLGQHQQQNGAAAVMALLELARTRKALTRTAICQGLAHVRWPGRFQVLTVQGKQVVIDGAHNPAGITSFCQTYEQVFARRPRIFVFSVLADKDYTHMIQELFRSDDEVYVAPVPNPRTADPKVLCPQLPCHATPCQCLEEAVDRAFTHATDEDVICLVGSLYMQGVVRAYLREHYQESL